MIIRRSFKKFFMLIFVNMIILLSYSNCFSKDFIYVPVVNALQIIDCDTDTVIETIPYNDYIMTSVYSPDGKKYFLNAQHSIYVINTETNKMEDVFRLSSDLSKTTILGFDISPDGKTLYLSCSIVKKKQNIPKLNVLPPQLLLFDITSKQVVKNFEIPYGVTGVIALRNDMDHVILWGLNIYKLNLKSGKYDIVMGILNADVPKNSLVIWNNSSPKDHGLFTNPYYTASGMGYIIIDRNSGDIKTLEGKEVIFEYSTIVSPDKKYLYGVMDDLIKIDFQTGETVKKIPVKQGTCYALSMTSDGKKIYVGPAGADISVYNAETLDLIGVIPLNGDGVVAHRISK